jgi:argininosuccinate lyase
MRALVSRHWSQATDLADMIVKATPLSFREAHRVVGALVARSLNSGTLPEEVTLADLESAAGEVLAERVDLSQVNLHEAMDARKALDRRKFPGGPAPALVEAVVDDARGQWRDDTRLHAGAVAKLETASSRLKQTARQMTQA